MSALRLSLVITILLLLSPSADAEYFYMGIGIGKNDILFSDQKWEYQGELGCSFRAGYRHHIGGSFYGDVGYTHHSQCLAGKPFGDPNKFESSSDHLYYYFEVRI